MTLHGDSPNQEGNVIPPPAEAQTDVISRASPRLCTVHWLCNELFSLPAEFEALQAKEMLEEAGLEPGSQLVVLGGATVAGFFAAACSLPFDFVKTRIQEMPRLPDGSFPYKGFADCALKTAREEGLGRFYTGFPTYCARSAASILESGFCCLLLPMNKL